MRYQEASLKTWKQIFEAFLLLCTLCLIPGCLWGNGEGYGNKPIGSSSVGLSNGIYYEIVPGFSCAYKRSIEIQGEQIHLTEGCNNTSQTLSAESLETDLSQNYIGYEEGIFEKRSTPPVSGNPSETYAEAFCTAALPTATSYVEIIVKKLSVNPNPSADLTSWNGELLKETYSVQKSDGVDERIYESLNFSLRIEQSPISTQPTKYRGEVLFYEGGSQVTRELNCRMLKP